MGANKCACIWWLLTEVAETFEKCSTARTMWHKVKLAWYLKDSEWEIECWFTARDRDRERVNEKGWLFIVNDEVAYVLRSVHEHFFLASVSLCFLFFFWISNWLLDVRLHNYLYIRNVVVIVCILESLHSKMCNALWMNHPSQNVYTNCYSCFVCAFLHSRFWLVSLLCQIFRSFPHLFLQSL